MLAIGACFVSHEQAEQNHAQEVGSKSFDDVVTENHLAGRSLLGRVQSKPWTRSV